jgi:hypothetical protein
MARPWRVAGCLLTLRSEINVAYPKRDKASDGTIGDADHATRASDHNPWVIDRNGIGVVRAFDCDVDGIPAAAIVEKIRKLGAAGDVRLRGGYLIFNGQITKADWSGWVKYTGPNKHTLHWHLSVTQGTAYDSTAGWGIRTAVGKDRDMTKAEFQAALKEALPEIARAVAGYKNPDVKASERDDIFQMVVDARTDARAARKAAEQAAAQTRGDTP